MCVSVCKYTQCISKVISVKYLVSSNYISERAQFPENLKTRLTFNGNKEKKVYVCILLDVKLSNTKEIRD